MPKGKKDLEVVLTCPFSASAEEIKDNNLDTKFSVYSGMFDTQIQEKK